MIQHFYLPFFEKLQLSTEELENACRKWGMKISAAKCKVISSDIRDVLVDDTPVER